jgi:hypothetical protein
MTHHPDRGGDADTFKGMTRAYDVLGCPDKRRLYDQGGDEAVDQGPSHDVRQPKGRARSHTLDVTLEEVYAGKTRKMSVSRNVVDRDTPPARCEACDGTGATVQTINLGPMLQRVRAACPACAGQGQRVGRKHVREVLEVRIDKGASDGQRLVFPEKGDEQPGVVTGDVEFVLREVPHARFRRRGADLYVERDIALVEALCGFETEIEHLDGRTLVVRATGVTRPAADPFVEAPVRWETIASSDCTLEAIAEAGTTDPAVLYAAVATGELRDAGIGCIVVRDGRAFFKPGSRAECVAARVDAPGSTMHVPVEPDVAGRMMRCVVGEGLPTARDPTEFGNLFLVLNVRFPDTVPAEAADDLRRALGEPLNRATADPSDPTVYVCGLETRDPVASYDANRPAEPPREDELPGGCQQQ